MVEFTLARMRERWRKMDIPVASKGVFRHRASPRICCPTPWTLHTSLHGPKWLGIMHPTNPTTKVRAHPVDRSPVGHVTQHISMYARSLFELLHLESQKFVLFGDYDLHDLQHNESCRRPGVPCRLSPSETIASECDSVKPDTESRRRLLVPPLFFLICCELSVCTALSTHLFMDGLVGRLTAERALRRGRGSSQPLTLCT